MSRGRHLLGNGDYKYIKVKIITTGSSQIDELTVRNAINTALGDVFGLVGTAVQVDILDWKQENEDKGTAIIRASRDDFNAIWSSLTMFGGNINGFPTRFQVLKTSSQLLALAQ